MFVTKLVKTLKLHSIWLSKSSMMINDFINRNVFMVYLTCMQYISKKVNIIFIEHFINKVQQWWPSCVYIHFRVQQPEHIEISLETTIVLPYIYMLFCSFYRMQFCYIYFMLYFVMLYLLYNLIRILFYAM